MTSTSNRRLVLFLTTCVLAGPAAFGWTLQFTFNNGTEGRKADEPNFGAFAGTLYTTEQSYEGGKGLILHARQGESGWGYWGGSIKFPTRLRKGDQVWWRVRTYWPAGQSYEADPQLKFMRLHTRSDTESNYGYDDWLIHRPGSAQAFHYSYEGNPVRRDMGTPGDAIVPDRWETYEWHVRFANVPADAGGTALVRCWKNGKLLLEVTDLPTLKKPEGYSDYAYLFTYWNSAPYIGCFPYESGGGPFQLGELVRGSLYTGTLFKVTKQITSGVWLRDPEPDWRRIVKPFNVLKVGETLTGQSSGRTAVITKVLHTHPKADTHIYVDDIYMTTETPSCRDEHGNPITDDCRAAGRPPTPAGVHVAPAP